MSIIRCNPYLGPVIAQTTQPTNKVAVIQINTHRLSKLFTMGYMTSYKATTKYNKTSEMP